MASFCSNEPRSRPGRPSKRRDDSLEKFGNPGFHVSWASPARDRPEWSLLEHAQLHVTLYPAYVPIGSRRPGWAKKIREDGNATGVPQTPCCDSKGERCAPFCQKPSMAKYEPVVYTRVHEIFFWQPQQTGLACVHVTYFF